MATSSMQWSKSNLTGDVKINVKTLEKLQKYLHQKNPYYKLFKAICELDPNIFKKYRIVLKANKKVTQNEHKGQFHLPTCNEVAVIDLEPDNYETADFVVQLRDGGLISISEQNRSYSPLHFILLNLNGDPGWHTKLTMTTLDGYQIKSHKGGLSSVQFARYLMMIRRNQFNPYIQGMYIYLLII